MLYHITRLTKVYGTRRVLDIPELVFEKEKIYGLLGPNGAGKTTLLEILSFLVTPTAGRIKFNSRDVDFSPAFLYEMRKEVVMIPQTPILFTTSVYKNLEFGLKIRKIPSGQREKIIHEMLDLVGMRPFAQARANRLSGGETQRVAIARAVACLPKVLFFDEPTANVDVENQVVIENIIRDINREKKLSIILTTHNMIQATRLTDEVIFLFDGRPADSIYENMFTGFVSTDPDGNQYCTIQDQVRLKIKHAVQGKVKVSIDPRTIRLRLHDSIPSSNGLLLGRIIQVTAERSDVRILVDVGIPLSSLLALEEYRASAFQVGTTVSVDCPPEAIEIM